MSSVLITREEYMKLKKAEAKLELIENRGVDRGEILSMWSRIEKFVEKEVSHVPDFKE